MNFLLFTLEYPPFKGGVANYYNNIIKYWPEPTNIFVLNNNESKLIKNWIFPRWLPALYYLYKEIQNKKINHILVGQILPLGTVTYLMVKFTKTPYSVIMHGMDFAYAQKSARKAKITEKILSRAVQIICTNSYLAGLVNNTYDHKFSDKIHIINPGIDVVNFGNKISPLTRRAEEINLQDKIILLSIGRLVKRKGFDKVIEAMPEILGSIPNLAYVIAGTGPDENYLKNKAENFKNIIFLGKITDEEKWAWLENCDIFITVSREIDGDFEGFGIVYLEANLAGKPVIAGHSGGVADAVQNNINGLLINPESKKEIISAIAKLAQDKNLREKLGGQGRERALKNFRWQDKAGELYKILR